MEYELRSKTKRTLPSVEEQLELAGLIDKILKMSFEEAQEYIWQLTYNPTVTLGPHIIHLKSPSVEKVRVIRGELISQYRKVNSGFGYQERTERKKPKHTGGSKKDNMIPEKAENPIVTKLRKRAEGDGVIVCNIQRKVEKCPINAELAKWYVKSLRNEKYKNLLTVLKDIGFKGDGEAGFVMKYADIIADLLEAKAETSI